MLLTIFPRKISSKISFQTSPEVRHQFRRKLRQLHSGNRWCLLNYYFLGRHTSLQNETAPEKKIIKLMRRTVWKTGKSRAAKRGGFKRGVSRSGLVLFLSFPDFSGIFPICSGMVRGFSRFVPFLFLGLLEHLRGTVPKGSATQSGPFPKKWETPRFGNPPV